MTAKLARAVRRAFEAAPGTPSRRLPVLVGIGSAALLLVAALSFWLGGFPPVGGRTAAGAQAPSAPGESAAAALEERLRIQDAVSREYTRRVLSLLEGPFGPGRVRATVSVELDFDRAEEVARAFDPPGEGLAVVRSRKSSEERFEQNQGAAVVQAPGKSKGGRVEEAVRYELNETERRREIPPGALKKVSAAVLIDGELSDEAKNSVAQAVAGALGLDPSRGDRVHVDAFPFAAGIQAAPSAQSAPPGPWLQYALPGGTALLAFALLIHTAALLGQRPRAIFAKAGRHRGAALASGEAEGEAGRGPFALARKASPEELLPLIQDERPQTIALILAHLRPEQAGRLLSALPPDRQAEVARRLASLGAVSAEALADVERELEKGLAAGAIPQAPAAGGVEAAADVLQWTDREAARAILERIEDEDPELADEIGGRMFSFEDLVRLGPRALGLAAQEVDCRDLALALTAAGDSVARRVLRSMPKRAAESLKQEMERIGPVRLQDVEDAQQKVAAVLRRLEKAGKISRRGPVRQVDASG